MSPGSLLTLQRAAAVKRRMAQIDRQVGELAADGYMVDADRLLDERLELAAYRAQLAAGRVPSG